MMEKTDPDWAPSLSIRPLSPPVFGITRISCRAGNTRRRNHTADTVQTFSELRLFAAGESHPGQPERQSGEERSRCWTADRLCSDDLRAATVLSVLLHAAVLRILQAIGGIPTGTDRQLRYVFNHSWNLHISRFELMHQITRINPALASICISQSEDWPMNSQLGYFTLFIFFIWTHFIIHLVQLMSYQHHGKTY